MTERRQSCEFCLEPLANLRCENTDAQWQACTALTSDPQLRADLAPDGIAPGFWRLRLALECDRADATRLYPDYGRGVTEAASVVIPRKPNTSLCQGIIYFPEHVLALRLDPIESEGAFGVGTLRCEPVTPAEALWCDATVLLRDVARHSAQIAATIARQVEACALADGPAEAWALLHQRVSGASAGQEEVSYASWIEAFDPAMTEEDRQIRAMRSAQGDGPLISVLMPTYNAPLEWLRKAVDSVVAQSYPHWELCIADDASTSEASLTLLNELATRDARIRVVFRDKNGHISRATNTALEMARGEFVALLDQDDELHPHALHFVAEAISNTPDAVLIYSDEDKIDEHQNRFDPYFKPDWNPELLLGQNFISHLGVYRTDLLRRIGGFRAGVEGSQDHDLALRVVEQSNAEAIVHVPRVLYHWRAIEGSTARAASEKNYAAVAAERAVREHLERTEGHATVVALDNGHLRVRRPLPSPRPLVSLVVPTRDKVELLRLCVSSILEKSSYRDFEILIVDNGSVEAATLAYLSEMRHHHPQVRVLQWNRPFNYSEINNFAVSQASGSVIGLVNNDVEVISPDWLEELVSHAVRPDVGAVGAKLFYPDGSIQHAGVILGVHGVAAHPYSGCPADHPGQMNRANLLQAMSAVTGACLFVRKHAFEAVGGLDVDLAVAFNDIDLCLKLQAHGLRNLWTPFAHLYHHESASRGHEDSAEKQQRFMGEVEHMRARWGELLDNDPCYNPNLTRSGTPFALAAKSGTP